MLEHMRRICLDSIHQKVVSCLNCSQPMTVSMVNHGPLRQSLDRTLEKKVGLEGVFQTGSNGNCEFVIGVHIASIQPETPREVIEGVLQSEAETPHEVIDGTLCMGHCTCGHADEMLLALPFSQYQEYRRNHS